MRRDLARLPRGRRLIASLVTMLTLPVLAASAQAQPTPAAPVVIDGPSAGIAGTGSSGLGLSVVHDGTGGLVYLKNVAGVDHVFVSRLAGGSFQPPEQIDSTLSGGSSQPVIAAGQGGTLLIAFINGGQLYVVERASSQARFARPHPLAPPGAQAENPSLQMTTIGKAYLAFTLADGSGHDVRAAYYEKGSWKLESTPLNSTAQDDAGTGAGRPRVAAAGDGVGIVVWGEAAHVYSRKVWGTAVYETEQADAPLSGCTERSADEPTVAAGGDSSYVDVAFREQLACGSPPQQETRVLVNRLQASMYDGVAEADGLSPASADNAWEPQVAMDEYGFGLVASAGQLSNDVWAKQLGYNGDTGTPGNIVQANSSAGASNPYPVLGVAGLYTTVLAWQQDPGEHGLPEIRIRYAPDGVDLNPETVLSSPSFGPTDAADGLATSGDWAGDAAVVWVQGAPGARQIVAAQLYQPPGGFRIRQSFSYSRWAHPTLSWTPAKDEWGVRYTVNIDGVEVARTTQTSVRVPSPVPDGPHTWQVTASNAAGLTSTTAPARLFVDTVPPVAGLTLHGAMRTGSSVNADISYFDRPPSSEPPQDASGVARVVLRWGDGQVVDVRSGQQRISHVYHGAGRYKLSLTVVDRAGNSTTLVRHIRITG